MVLVEAIFFRRLSAAWACTAPVASSSDIASIKMRIMDFPEGWDGASEVTGNPTTEQADGMRDGLQSQS